MISSEKYRSYTLVSIQFICLAIIILTGPLFASGMIYLMIEVIGILLGSWAIWTLKIGNFNISPDVKENGVFVQKGAYEYIRHPMYTALILATFALVFDSWSYLRFITWIVLIVDLFLKFSYEEKLLQKHFPEYMKYQGQTKRLIPYLF